MKQERQAGRRKRILKSAETCRSVSRYSKKLKIQWIPLWLLRNSSSGTGVCVRDLICFVCKGVSEKKGSKRKMG